jgi:hypothetical protein
MLPLKATMQTWKWHGKQQSHDSLEKGGLVHPQAIGRCFVTLFILEFEKELGVCPKREVGMICC